MAPFPSTKDETLLKAVARVDTKDRGVSMTSLSEALGRPVAFDWAPRGSPSDSPVLRIRLEPLILDEKAWQEISEIETERYGNDTWTLKRLD